MFRALAEGPERRKRVERRVCKKTIPLVRTIFLWFPRPGRSYGFCLWSLKSSALDHSAAAPPNFYAIIVISTVDCKGPRMVIGYMLVVADGGFRGRPSLASPLQSLASLERHFHRGFHRWELFLWQPSCITVHLHLSHLPWKRLNDCQMIKRLWVQMPLAG